MKILLSVMTLAISLSTIGVRADESEYRPRPPLRKHCDCIELERRLQGLNLVLTQVRIDQRERQMVRQDFDQAYRYYERVDFNRTSLGDQSRLCSLGNMEADRSWRRWQPWLARRGWDPGNRCESGEESLSLLGPSVE